MKGKNIVTVVLLLFVALSVVFMLLKDTGRRSEGGPAEVDAARAGGAQDHVVVAYYFHRTARCVTCNRIEEYTKESLESAFADLIESGGLEFHSVDVQRPENVHFIAAYRLTSPTTVLVDMRGGEQARWKNLDRVWSHVRNKEAFMQYVQNETREYLGELLNE